MRAQDEIVATAETLAQGGDSNAALHTLRELSLADFGELLLGVSDRFPALKAQLPTMPPESVQVGWTGNHGKALLGQTVAFVEALSTARETILGHGLQDAKILDYGCGWGRILRLMLRFSEPETIYGIDPWDKSVELCHDHGVPGNLAQCDYVPDAIPFSDVRFDVVYAFSVFTHLAERVGDAVQKVVRDRIEPDGLFAITVRPCAYWDAHKDLPAGYDKKSLQDRHRELGFAFAPHAGHGGRMFEDDSDAEYGDASMTVEHIQANWSGWKVAGSDRSRSDPLQDYIFLVPC